MNSLSPEQRQACRDMVDAVAEAIQALGHVPSGELYAHLMGTFTLQSYNTILDILRMQGKIKIQNHLITWIGGKA
jgi:DNA-binding ferritin-like protein